MLGKGGAIEPGGCGLHDQVNGGITNRVGNEWLVLLGHTTSLGLQIDCTDLDMDFGVLSVYKTVITRHGAQRSTVAL